MGKFKIGDEVIYMGKFPATIKALAQNDVHNRYAITFRRDDGNFKHAVVPSKTISRRLIEVGDYVSVFDNSYAIKVKDGDLRKNAYPAGLDKDRMGNKTFEVLVTDVVLPDDNDSYTNDTIIRDVGNDEIYYTRKEFLSLVEVAE